MATYGAGNSRGRGEKVMLIEIDEKKVFEHWTEERIEGYAKELNMTYLEAMLYLWLFNFVSVSSDDQKKDCGREMYKKFARGMAEFLEGRY